MNKLIKQKIDLLSVSEQATEQIKVKPREKMLQQMTDSSKQQGLFYQDLQKQTDHIQESSEETLKALETQIRQAENLVTYTQEVIKFIQLFKLPTH
jgi:uncharacterized membrane protein YheB (UPF0754 family)